jgi:protein TonB
VGSGRAARRSWSFAVSLLAQAAVLGLVVLGTLMYTPLLPAARFTAVFLEPPPPPPGPPPPPPEQVVAVQPERFPAELMQPQKIPTVLIVDPPDAPLAQTFIGVPGGSDTGVPNGVIDSIATSVPPPARPAEKPRVERAPDPPAPAGPVKVSSGVQAARLIRRVEPAYPPLARQARISGAVRLRAIISADGAVEQLNILSGHPLLIRAAADAVRQWRYRPTLLSGRAVPVSTEIEVNFVLR